MAWQLIYTSAPRSLEAGRSGFGTVARHRAISPLLVSAIERASQFSRLPGTDAGRVIFSHRIVAVAGGRFHVLSAIRDAGADYTGRTNHIAHHLIVDPREIAQLGPDGPSPADVLLAMRWAASWNESPRFLEASDEVSLSAILPHTNGSAWEQITGNANQAWLLATGDASRGAYIIQPGSADLREVFAESLRLIPDRLWQISFTTSLQPSDEPGDFRWIGIEERSPLRAQSESSGRPVLNLALPDTLPLVETVQRPAVSQIRQNSEPASAPAWNELPTASTETSPVVSGSHSSPTRQRTAITPSASSTRSSRISPKWWLLAGAVVAVSIVGMLVFSMFVKPYLEKQKARNAMAESFATTGYFSNDTSRKLANALVISADDSRCKELAGASNALIQILLDGDLQKLEPKLTSDNIEVLANRDGLHPPDELRILRETVKDAQRLSVKPSEVEKAADVNHLVIIMKNRYDEITNWAPGKSLQKLVGALHANADQQQAEGLLTIVQQRMSPPGGIEPFKQIVAAFKKNVPNPTARTTIVIDQIEKLLEEQVAKLQPTPKPEPVRPSPPAEKLVIAENPAVPSQVPLYFIRGLDALTTVSIAEMKAGSDYALSEDLMSEPRPMFKNPDQEGKEFNLRRNFTDKELAFLVDEKNKLVKPQADEKTFRLPAILLIKGSKGEKLAYIYILPSDLQVVKNPIFGKSEVGILRADHILSLDFSKLSVPGKPKTPLRLRLPPLVPAKVNSRSKNAEYVALLSQKSLESFDDNRFTTKKLQDGLSNEVNRLTNLLNAKSAEITKLQQYTREPEFAELKRKFKKDSGLDGEIKGEEKRREGKPAKAPIPEINDLKDGPAIETQFGGALVAYTRVGGLIHARAGGVNHTMFAHDAGVLKAGEALVALKLPNDNIKKLIADARDELGKARNNLQGQKDIMAKYDPSLKILEDMASVVVDKGAKDREKTISNFTNDVREFESERIEVLKNVALLKAIPGGKFCLVTVVEGTEVPLIDIEMPAQ